ncbi:ORF042 [Saltwater crocodilepox virus]|nr:ORF042 [Saltwater crocodilepox virus]QGT49050.1 ORF042 [Saltwater crocodilepox virus]
MSPRRITLIIVVALLTFETGHAIKESITFEECRADPQYCRYNYGRQKHKTLDEIFSWLLVLIVPPLGAANIVLGSADRELAAAALDFGTEAGMEEIVGGGRPIELPNPEAEVVEDLSVRVPRIDAEVPDGNGGPVGSSNIIDALEELIQDIRNEDGFQDFRLPNRVNDFLEDLDRVGNLFEDLAEDFEPELPDFGSSSEAADPHPEGSPGILHKTTLHLIGSYNRFQSYQQSFRELTQIASTSDLEGVGRDMLLERLEELGHKMGNEINRMHRVLSSDSLKDYLKSLESDFQVPRLQEDVKQVLTEANKKYGTVRVVSGDPNDPLEGGSQDVFARRGNRPNSEAKGLEQHEHLETSDSSSSTESESSSSQDSDASSETESSSKSRPRSKSRSRSRTKTKEKESDRDEDAAAPAKRQRLDSGSESTSDSDNEDPK